MRKLRLKEKEADYFLQMKGSDKGAVLSLEKDGVVQNDFTLSLKQLGQLREWCIEQQNDIFKRTRIDMKAGK